MFEPGSRVSTLPVEPVIRIAIVPVVTMDPEFSMVSAPEPTNLIARLAVMLPLFVIVVDVLLNETMAISLAEIVPAFEIVAVSAPPLPPANTPTEARLVPGPIPLITPPARLVTSNVPTDSTAVPVTPVPPSEVIVPEFVTTRERELKTPNVPTALDPDAEMVPVLVRSIA